MNQEQLTAMRERCASYLQANDLTIKTVKGKNACHGFWLGAISTLETLGQHAPPIISIRLMSGRYEELV